MRNIPVVILWAGCGRRISETIGGMHKSQIKLLGRTLMDRLLDNIYLAGATEIIPVLGYRSDEMLDAIEDCVWRENGCIFEKITPVINKDYNKTNNLGSLLKAEEELKGREFTVVNGDMVFDWRILKNILAVDGSAVGADLKSYPKQLDSPRLLIKDGRILDIGRHMTIDNAQGYAIGIYKFGEDISRDYFELGKKLLAENPNAGYHDVLIGNLEKYKFIPSSVGDYLWMDVDEPDDIEKAEEFIKNID